MIFNLTTQRGFTYTVGVNCDHISEHIAQGEGDRWFYDVHRKNTVIRIFDPVEVSMRLDSNPAMIKEQKNE